jgi:hypothetical protein
MYVLNYPIVARKHEMISSKASIPIGVLSLNDTDIIYDSVSNRTKIMGVTNIDKSDKHCHAEGKEEDVCFLRIPGSELVVHLNPIDEIPFC